MSNKYRGVERVGRDLFKRCDHLKDIRSFTIFGYKQEEVRAKLIVADDKIQGIRHALPRERLSEYQHPDM
ncbi:hypothetical protein D3C73_1608010 [compost metagenome]